MTKKKKEDEMAKATITVYQGDKKRLAELSKLIESTPEEIVAQALYDFACKKFGTKSQAVNRLYE